VMLEVKSRTSLVLDKCSTTESHPQAVCNCFRKAFSKEHVIHCQHYHQQVLNTQGENQNIYKQNLKVVQFPYIFNSSKS
jgi:hypothetical protein